MDCMEGMKHFPDKYFDLAIVDPPYGVDVANREHSGYGDCYDKRNGKNVLIKQKRRKWVKKNWDKSIPSQEYFNELRKVAKVQIIWGINYFTSVIPDFPSGRLVWCKAPILKKNYELAGISNKKGVAYFEFLWNGILQGKSLKEGNVMIGDTSKYENRIHPTQKPIALYKWLLMNYAKPDFKILDTHAGSCSSVIAFLDFGCDWIAFELDKDYYEAASKRIENHKLQLKLF